MAGPFGHEYAEVNEDGLVSLLRCQCCGTPVGGLSEAPSQKFPGRTFTRLRRHANFRTREIMLSDGSKCLIFLCGECVEVDIDPYAVNIGRQIRAAWRREMEANHRPAEQIEALMERTRGLKALTKTEALLARLKPAEPAPLKKLLQEATRGG